MASEQYFKGGECARCKQKTWLKLMPATADGPSAPYLCFSCWMVMKEVLAKFAQGL